MVIGCCNLENKKHLINDHGFTLQEIEETVPIYESGLTEE